MHVVVTGAHGACIQGPCVPLYGAGAKWGTSHSQHTAVVLLATALAGAHKAGPAEVAVWYRKLVGPLGELPWRWGGAGTYAGSRPLSPCDKCDKKYAITGQTLSCTYKAAWPVYKVAWPVATKRPSRVLHRPC